jgi:hypothetical protein
MPFSKLYECQIDLEINLRRYSKYNSEVIKICCFEFNEIHATSTSITLLLQNMTKLILASVVVLNFNAL